MRLAFVRARTPLFGGYAACVILEHIENCRFMLNQIDWDGGFEYPDLLMDV
jgi:hypothetical protein